VFTCGDPEQAYNASDLLIQCFHASDYTRTELRRGPLSQSVSVAQTRG
jgi:S-adenosylmethionine/arginine decarboxylase-like enzyme